MPSTMFPIPSPFAAGRTENEDSRSRQGIRS